jgi:hypothetical protein
MALQGGHRFPVSMAEAFPHGVYAMGVKQAEDFNSQTKRSKPSRDPQNGDQFVWTVTCIDRDPDAREKEVKVKVTAPVMPVLPEEVLPGSGLRMVEFTGLTVTPYVPDVAPGRKPRMVLSFRAQGVYEQGKVPAVDPGAAGVRVSKPVGGPTEGKAA